MADFTVRTDDLRRAGEELLRGAEYVEPRAAEVAVSQGALASTTVYAALYAANLKQTTAARKQAKELGSLGKLLFGAADAIEAHDEDLADEARW